MLNFKPIDENNIIEISNYFAAQKYRTSDYTVGGVFMWSDFLKTEFAVTNGFLFFKVKRMEGNYAFSFPIGSKDIHSALNELEEYCTANNIPLCFSNVPAAALDILKERYGENLHATNERDAADYLYLYEDLRTFAGRRYSGQRNHMNAFKKLYPEYSYSPITSENKERIKEFFQEYMAQAKKKDGGYFEPEFKAAVAFLDYLDKFHMYGGFIEVNEKIIAASVGEVVGDTMFVHIEKALSSFRGSYQMIVREFLEHNADEKIRYVNREDDAGDLGLRTSKLSYHPLHLLEKNFVEIKL